MKCGGRKKTSLGLNNTCGKNGMDDYDIQESLDTGGLHEINSANEYHWLDHKTLVEPPEHFNYMEGCSYLTSAHSKWSDLVNQILESSMHWNWSLVRMWECTHPTPRNHQPYIRSSSHKLLTTFPRLSICKAGKLLINLDSLGRCAKLGSLIQLLYLKLISISVQGIMN